MHSLDGDSLVPKRYFHIGFAAGHARTVMVVPVIRDADQRACSQIAQEMGELAKLARDGKLEARPDAGRLASPISLARRHQRHLLHADHQRPLKSRSWGVSFMKPVWDGKQFMLRLTLPLSHPGSLRHRFVLRPRFNSYLRQIRRLPARRDVVKRRSDAAVRQPRPGATQPVFDSGTRRAAAQTDCRAAFAIPARGVRA